LNLMPLKRPEGVAVTTAIPLTLNLLILIGLYELAAGFAGLTGRIDWQDLLDDFERSPALTFVTGFAVFAIGGAITIAHHHWTDLPAVIVSAIGWIAVFEGLLIMVWAKPLLSFSRDLIANQRAVSLMALIFGAALILLGLTGQADSIASI
jgi:hypothetical protein